VPWLHCQKLLVIVLGSVVIQFYASECTAGMPSVGQALISKCTSVFVFMIRPYFLGLYINRKDL